MSNVRRAGLHEGIQLLRDPSFAGLFGARSVSAFGTAMAPVAVAFALLDLTGSAQAIGIVLASQTTAQIAVQLFGGALADRWSRRKLMVTADILATASQTTVAWLLFSGEAQVWQLAVLEAVNGVAFALHGPAATGLVPLVVDRSRLQPANALLGLSHSGAFALGGAAAGVLVATIGSAAAIAVDAATFAVSGLFLVWIRPRAQHRGGVTTMWADLRDGWREFVSHRWLWAIVAQFSIMLAAWQGGFAVVGPVVAARSLGGPEAWGLVAGSLGAGLLVGGVLGLVLHVTRPMLVATLAVLAHALPMLLLIEPQPLVWVSLGAFVAGVGGEIFGVLWFTALHTHVAQEKLSRVSAYDSLGSFALAPLGLALAGWIVDNHGAPIALAIAALGIVVPTLAVLVVPEVRNLRSEPTPGLRSER